MVCFSRQYIFKTSILGTSKVEGSEEINEPSLHCLIVPRIFPRPHPSARLESCQTGGKLPGGWKDCCKLEGGQPDRRFLTVENFQASGASGRMESFRVDGKLLGGWKASEWMESFRVDGKLPQGWQYDQE